MVDKNISNKKSDDISLWLREDLEIDADEEVHEESVIKNKTGKKKKELAFGYGYDPEILRSGIEDYKFSHEIKQGKKLYTFNPKLSYRIFNELAAIIRYKNIGSELRNGNTIIKNQYFITDKNPGD
ncbi:MAG: hypothetical protein GF311_27210, partial [Candidatus Lokiarchaeota archaeon]|nr:hypothetical protein [Candidatus Lokiarchaeota archaeon]